MRYKPKHMYLVGIIPSPHEPPLTTLNHYLTPLVDDFLDFWHSGLGRLVRCTIVCVVCDLPAARKTSGFRPSSHSHFCAVCHCTRQNHGYGDINYHLWQRRMKEECLASAKAFNEAETKSEQDMAFASSGVKWSELLCLPYFDPTRFVVIDPMHNLFLGLINKHFQNILGIRLDKDTEQSVPAINIHFTDLRWDILKEAEKKDCKRLLAWLRNPLNSELNTTEEMDEIRNDIVNMLRPSWLTSVPSDFRSVGHGKLKADQWRVLGTTILPVLLVRLWSVIEVGNSRSERCRRILDMTMSLLSAVAIACSRVTSKKHVELYFKNMHSYLSSLKVLFPQYSFHPNHHMALHLSEYLLLYGPVHSWWTFPFEQLIGILQRISTNYKIGWLTNLFFSSISN
ncbi:hypothetical protein BYT27DRAFT_7224974 [Phlegmacium glaucopus]|nr:hypothetical protein BYT27DRAFT_7224974 [Phlegmacium glaucopus]